MGTNLQGQTSGLAGEADWIYSDRGGDTMTTLMERLQLDEDGYLMNIDTWSVNMAEELAKLEGIKKMKAEHWKIITAIRHHYEKTGVSPLCRDILKETGFTKKDLYTLFPSGHRGAYKIAGLPKPPEC